MDYRQQADDLLVIAGNGRVLARGLRTGAVRWTYDLKPPALPSSAHALLRVAVTPDAVIVFAAEVAERSTVFGVASVHLVVLALERESGAVRWRQLLYTGDVRHTPGTLLVDGGVIVAATTYATAAYDLRTGQLLWADKNMQFAGFTETGLTHGVALATDRVTVPADGQ